MTAYALHARSGLRPVRASLSGSPTAPIRTRAAGDTDVLHTRDVPGCNSGKPELTAVPARVQPGPVGAARLDCTR